MSLKNDILAKQQLVDQSREELRQAAPIMIRMAREYIREGTHNDLTAIKRQLRRFDSRSGRWRGPQ